MVAGRPARADGRRVIERVVSGGQTGVDRAALDAALDAGIARGGWCPRGRRAEDRIIPPRYPLTETGSRRYIERTRLNVRDSDGTLVLGWGPPAGGTRAAAAHAGRLGRPLLVFDLAGAHHDPAAGAAAARRWIVEHDIRILNVAGPRASQGVDVEARARDFLRLLLLDSPARGRA